MNGKGSRIFWIIFFLIVAGLAVVIYVIPGAQSLLAQTSVVEYGEIILRTETEAYLVREETAFPESGPGAAYFYEEGERIRKGSNLYQIGGATKRAEWSGAVSYYVDGHEDVLTPETMETIGRATVESWYPVTEGAEGAEGGETVSQPGDSLGKIKLVREDEWFLLYWTEAADAKNYAVGKTVSVTFADGTVLPMTVRTVAEEENGVRIILRTTRFYDAMQKDRRTEISVVTSDRTGLLVKNTCIGYADNMEGVWVKQVSGDFRFVPVNVLSTDGTYSVVSEGSFTRTTTEGGTARQTTINAYDEIRNTPPKEE
jgi:putative membrane fusion protein